MFCVTLTCAPSSQGKDGGLTAAELQREAVLAAGWPLCWADLASRVLGSSIL